MAASSEYVAYIVDLLHAMGEVAARSMFGGAGLYLDGTMFALITADDRFYFRVDAETRGDFEAAGSAPFKPRDARGRERAMTMPYFEVPVDVMEDEEVLAQWGRRAWEAARRAKAVKARR